MEGEGGVKSVWAWLSSLRLRSLAPPTLPSLSLSDSLPSLDSLSNIHVPPPPDPTTAVIILLILLFFVILLLLCTRGGRCLPLSPSSRILLVIAHPDDETMFFAPSICRLREQGHHIYVLCVCTGDFYGQGQLRVSELRQAVQRLGIEEGDLTILDYDMFKDGHPWDKSALGRVLLNHVEVLDINCILSFDSSGVSSHPNHISCFEALQECYSKGELPADVQVFCLDSVSLFRKYISLLDAPFSVTRSPFRYFSSPRYVFRTWRAMAAHRSQLLWFRYLFMIFSRYILINTFRRIPPQTRHPRRKKEN